MWEQWAADCGRTDDLIIFDKAGDWRFNFLEWEASRPGEGGGLTINIVALLDEIAGAVASSAGKVDGKGDNKFWEDALHHLNTNLVELPVFAGLVISLPLMRSIVNSAPQSLEQMSDPQWQQDSACWAIIAEADKATIKADADIRADFEECRNYWLQEFPVLSEKTRSIITLTFSMMVRPLITRPLRKLFSSDTNVTPEDAFDGKIIIVDLPVQEFRLAGRLSNLAWKYCFPSRRVAADATGERIPPPGIPCGLTRRRISFPNSTPNIRPWPGPQEDAPSISRRTENRFAASSETTTRWIHCLATCRQNSFARIPGDTNDWAARLLGERWVPVNSTNVSQSQKDAAQMSQGDNHSSGVSRSEQRRYFVEPSRFTTLKRGGALNDFQVQAVVYNGGTLFTSGPGKEPLPYHLLTFNQK